MFMMNLTTSLYTKLYNKIFDYRVNYKNKYTLENYHGSEKNHIYDKTTNGNNMNGNNIMKSNITNYMIDSNNKAFKLYNKLNFSNLLISKIMKPNLDIEYDHNNETIICQTEKYNHFIKKNGVEFVLVFIFGVLAHFHFQRSYR
jgi:hypothetical protein